MFKCSFPSALTTVYRTSICMFHMSHISFVWFVKVIKQQ